MVESRQAQGEIELQKADIRGIGQARAVQCLRWIEAGFAVGGSEKFHPSLRDAGNHRHHLRVIQRLEQGGVDAVRLQLVSDPTKQLGQALAWVRHLLDGADDLRFTVLFPALQRRAEQCFAGAEMPVEAAFGNADLTRQRFDRQRPHALLGNRFKRGQFPILGGQAATLGFVAHIHPSMLAIHWGFVMRAVHVPG